MKYKLDNKKVLITGASGGIGKSLCEKFIGSNCNIVCTSSSIEKLDNLKYLYGNNHNYYLLNFSNSNSFFDSIKQIAQEHRDIDILINNAGITKDNIIARMSMDEWEEVINIHLNATFYMCQRATKLMMKNRFGRVINISSTSATIGNRGQGNYAAAKAGIEAFTRD